MFPRLRECYQFLHAAKLRCSNQFGKFFCASFQSVWNIGGKAYICPRNESQKGIPSPFRENMGMKHDTDITAILERDRSMTPKRLSVILGVSLDTLYRAWKKKNPGMGWAKGADLDSAGVDRIVFYYAALGNDTAVKLAENRKPERTERPRKEDGTPTEQTERPAQVDGTETERGGTHTESTRNTHGITMLDVVFVFILLLTGWNLYYFLGHWGAAFWIAYAGVSINALLMASRADIPRTARVGLSVVVVLEFIAFWTHLAMANLLLVNAAKKDLLPFQYDAWGTLEAPFYIALVVAAVLSGIAVYAVWVRISITSETSGK